MTDSKYTAFVAICNFEELLDIFRLIPNSWHMYVKSEIEEPGTRKVVFICPNKVSFDYAEKTVWLALKMCPTSCKSGYAKFMLRNKYIRWRNWMSESQYLKLSEKQRERTKFLDRKLLPSKTAPNKVHNFFTDPKY